MIAISSASAPTALPSTERSLRREKKRDALIKLACRKAVKAGDTLSQADIDRLEARGALVLQKPLNKALFLRTVRLAMVARRRLLEIKTENAGLHHKIEEIRLIDRAKCVLIQYLGLTEPQAHRYIEKQAMDRRVSRREVAAGILAAYET